MIAAFALFVLVTTVFLASVWGVCYYVLRLVNVGQPAPVATAGTALLLLAIGVFEYRGVGTVERLGGATAVDRDDAPELYRTTTAVATMLEVPVPTIAISESRAPEAMVVGYRSEEIHLVLSEGTIDALDDAELEAVIAHELAHVKNGDAMVMTAVSVPIVLAAGLRARLGDPDELGGLALLFLPLLLVSNVAWVAGRAIVAVLARARERAADRAAAEVTGSPATVASALERLDDRIDATPSQDLRAVAGVSALSILPLEPNPADRDVTLGPEGDVEPSFVWFDRLKWRLFATHPPTATRLEALRSLERSRTRERHRPDNGSG